MSGLTTKYMMKESVQNESLHYNNGKLKLSSYTRTEVPWIIIDYIVILKSVSIK